MEMYIDYLDKDPNSKTVSSGSNNRWYVITTDGQRLAESGTINEAKKELHRLAKRYNATIVLPPTEFWVEDIK